MRLSRKARREIQSQPVKSLGRFKDEAGHRLSSQAIGQELKRRIAAHQSTHPVIQKHRQKQKSRVLK